MSVVVFAGPTIGCAAVAEACPCRCLPPAAQGDVYRAALGGPRAIAIVDGYFHGVPAVWHKEILWAMTQGIHVFGSASMGALRAAELHDFGMRGVGEIFRQYRIGALTDDDEVAVLHAPAELGYAPLSEAMVNIRATLARAVEERVIAAASGDALCRAAKRLYYQRRDWPAVVAADTDSPVAAAERAALEAWLPEGRVDRKRADALAMLSEVRAFLATDPPPMRVDYQFEWTYLWDWVVTSTLPAQPGDGDAGVDVALLLDELRLEPEAFAAVRRAALLRWLAGAHGQDGDAVDRAAIRAAFARFRTERGLFSRAALDDWIAGNGLDETAFERLIAAEANIETLARDIDLQPFMLDELRVRGRFGPLRARARAKQDAVAGSAGVPAMPLRLLAEWFFESRLQGEVPDDLDGFAREIGLDGREELARILTHELVYTSPGVAYR
ncbi:MAG: TfuA-like protein, partial [Alphaproteobacteria bacterium]